ncbi:hypothetical protein SAMN05428984_4312 [Sphingomonas sp. OK281]|jgi:hypothetical protein|nr:hypothetical protein C8J43_10666 [Sphingomonas sp. PP-CE-1G-424]SFO45103.1 hypothetical protein SAMN05428984_4312 [Sphingomonas sp. OK281]
MIMKTFSLIDLGRASKVTAASLMGPVAERDSVTLRNYI